MQAGRRRYGGGKPETLAVYEYPITAAEEEEAAAGIGGLTLLLFRRLIFPVSDYRRPDPLPEAAAGNT